MNFQPITTDQDWSTFTVIRNRYQWSHPLSATENRNYYEGQIGKRIQAALLGYDGDTAKVGTIASQAINSPDNRFWVSIFVDPSDELAVEHAKAGLNEIHRFVSEQGGSQSMIEARSDQESVLHALVELGFTKGLVLPCSAISVQESDFEPQPGVVSFKQFLDANPEDGLHRLWRCEMEIAGDLPLPFPFVETPFEQFASNVTQPYVDLTSKFLLYEDGELKGLTQLYLTPVDPTMAATGLTGTRRAYRRQGVATRLKQHAISWAKSKGVKKIFTDNEENNPMFQLNLQLGFRREFDFVVYSKPC